MPSPGGGGGGGWGGGGGAAAGAGAGLRLGCLSTLYLQPISFPPQMPDGSPEGRASRLSLWSHPGNDVTGMVARAEKVAGTSREVRVCEVGVRARVGN